MKLILSSIVTITAVMTLLVNAAALAVEPAAVATEAATNTVCPITGKPVDPAITADYEGSFDDVSMDKQRRKQKEFLSAAFGGPLPWTGKDMRKAHEGMGLTEVHFNAIAENLVNTLKDLKISQELIDQVVAVALTTKDDVLGRPKKAN
jgi:hemoglobin